jgi:glycerol uptake facilitator-like aquaporin
MSQAAGLPRRLAADFIGSAFLAAIALARTGRAASAPAAVGAYIGAAYWFTASTSFANPAIMFRDEIALRVDTLLAEPPG